jgi:hypothetical protein
VKVVNRFQYSIEIADHRCDPYYIAILATVLGEQLVRVIIVHKFESLATFLSGRFQIAYILQIMGC